MRKHDEGYALVLVLVVILVLGIAATGLMTVTLNNLKTQQKLVERMVDKYDAMGKIEIAVATIHAKLETEEPCKIEVSGSEDDRFEAAVDKWLKEKLGDDAKDIEIDIKNDEFTCVISLEEKSESEQTVINCELTIRGTVEDVKDEPLQFMIEYKDFSYNSYQYASGGDTP